MSEYTTELRFICEEKAGLMKSVGENDVDRVISQSRREIFNFDYPIFSDEYKETLENKLKWRLSKSPMTSHMVPLEFTYGYAITCHKAQGSQWPNVMVFEEGFPFSKEEHARWLYTAVTRAENKLIVVKK